MARGLVLETAGREAAPALLSAGRRNTAESALDRPGITAQKGAPL